MTILKEPQYIILQKCKLSAKRIETVLTYLHSNLAKVCFLVQYTLFSGISVSKNELHFAEIHIELFISGDSERNSS